MKPIHAVLVTGIFLAGCAGGTQQTSWDANTSIAFSNERKGHIIEAESDYQRALFRARSHLSRNHVSDSLYNMGAFYLRNGMAAKAVAPLEESVTLEESLSGPGSERTGRRLATLTRAYLHNGDTVKAFSLAARLEPLARLYSGEERAFIDAIVTDAREAPEQDRVEVARLQPLADNGDPQALCQLADHYEAGRGVPKDPRKAVELYEAAANKGYRDAQYYLGVIYDAGRGVKQDQEKARRWYRKAAENGQPTAQYNYALFLLNGAGGPKDEAAARSWFKKASTQGLHAATLALNSMGK